MSNTNSDKKKTGLFSDFEQAAMHERAKELAAEAKATKKKADGEKILLDAVAKMPQSDKVIATKIHEIVSKVAPDLWPKTWYGMPAYTAGKDGKVVCFFQGADKFKTRYATLGFNDLAKLDEGNMWPTAFALKSLSSVEEAKISELVKKAVS